MTDAPGDDRLEQPDGEVDPGLPIDALAGLRHETSAGFFETIRRRIHRRRFASHLVDLAWSGPAVVLLEFLEMIFGLLGGGRSRNEEAD